MASKFIQYFIKHSVITNWLMIVISIAGIFALSNLNKRINPKFEIEDVNIDVPYPGASAIEVEEGIVVKIEESLRGMSLNLLGLFIIGLLLTKTQIYLSKVPNCFLTSINTFALVTADSIFNLFLIIPASFIREFILRLL